jgi:hypothetical protein
MERGFAIGEKLDDNLPERSPNTPAATMYWCWHFPGVEYRWATR